MEAFKQRGIEVLYLVDPIDEYVMQSYPEHEGHKFVCITKEGLKLPGAASEATPNEAPEAKAEVVALCAEMKRLLGARVEKVVPSERLATSPCRTADAISRTSSTARCASWN